MNCKFSLWAVGLVFAFGIVANYPTSAAPIIDDHFDDGDIATGGTNGGFVLVSNSAGGAGTVTEAGTLATLTTGTAGMNSNDGLYSLSSFDSTAVPGLTATIEITSLSGTPNVNGLFFGITDVNDDFFRVHPNFGLVFSGKAGTGSVNGFGLGSNDEGPGFDVMLASGTLDLPSLLDGFTAGFTVDQAGWSYEISGVTVGGVDTTLQDSGPHSGGFTYAGQFGDTDYLTTSVQRANAGLVMEVDRMTIEAIPEPASIVMVALGLAAAFAARRRRC